MDIPDRIPQVATMRRKLLCIEDNLETADLIAEEFQERGFDVTLAHDGQDGFAAVLGQRPDLVLCDVSMPSMTGFEVLDRLKDLSPRFSKMPFIYLTAIGDRGSELKGRRLGADDYVVKPIDFEILATIIDARLAKVTRSEIWSCEADLNQRELECLTWAARGKTSSEIAMIVGTSKRNVDFHVENACRKLDVATRIQAAVKAVSGGLIDP
jgi:DNA-binding response OmpR family regulator